MADNKFQTPEALARCLPMSRLQAVLSGKWKILILWYVAFYRVQRFGALLRRLDGITQSTLTRQLRELEADGFLHREVYPEVPPRVEYTLTAMGESFLPVLNHMLLWSETHLCPPDYVNPYQDGGALTIPSLRILSYKICICLSPYLYFYETLSTPPRPRLLLYSAPHCSPQC